MYEREAPHQRPGKENSDPVHDSSTSREQDVERPVVEKDDGKAKGEPRHSPENSEELRLRRSEEEARAGTREREAGALKVRKSVRTEREQVRVPKRREEVDIERVPGEGREASRADIGEVGEDEVIVVQVFEEEVVVSKRVVLKEEIRIRKKVVVEEEVIEVDLRKEVVDIEDTTRHGASHGVEKHEDSQNKV